MKHCRAGTWGGSQGAQSFPSALYWVMQRQYLHTLPHNVVLLPPLLLFCSEGCVSRRKQSWGCATEGIASNQAAAFSAVDMPFRLGSHQGDLQPPLPAFGLREEQRNTISLETPLWSQLLKYPGFDIRCGGSSWMCWWFPQCHHSQLITRHDAMKKMSPKLYFSYDVAVPIQTDHRNSCN